MAVMARAADIASLDSLQRVIAPAFDQGFYRTIYDDLPPDQSAFGHYAVQGWREGRDPAAWFSVPRYLEDNPDVARLGVEPLFHFLTQGRREGREVCPSRHAVAYIEAGKGLAEAWTWEGLERASSETERGSAPATPVRRISPEDARAAIAAAFDAGFYLASNPDVAAAGVDPLEHFLLTGWLEGRDPTARFSVRDYLDAHPDVENVNPFAHYLLVGRAEGRAAREQLGFRYSMIARSTPLERRLAEAEAASAATVTEPAARLVERLSLATGGLNDVHLTLSHDNYAEHTGGLQMCLRRESAMFRARGIDHLHLFPAAAWRMLREDGQPGPLGMLLNGRSLGVFSAGAVSEALAAVLPAGRGRRSFAIHSLLGHAPGETLAILRAAGLSRGFFWLHDFASLCAGFHLQRNDVEDCAAPPPDSAACQVCAYGPFRARHVEGHRALFEALSITVVAPSATTLDFWRARAALPAVSEVVLPHATLKGGRAAPRGEAGRPLRVAYLGMPSAMKGWPIFTELAERMADDPRYEFLHLGGRPDPSCAAAFHRVMATEARPDAMREALAELRVDAALIWPLCRETFSFTAYEAAAAGVAVITNPDSGNVAAFAAESGRGTVLADEAALIAAFASGAALEMARGRRKPRVHSLAYSGMTADLVPA